MKLQSQLLLAILLSVLPLLSGQDVPASNASGRFLALDECIEIAIINNLALKVSCLNDRESDVAVRSAWSQYYPDFGLNINSINSTNTSTAAASVSTAIPSTTPLVPIPITGTDSNTISGTMLQSSPWGTQLELLLSESRKNLDRSTATGNMEVSLTQHLWKGRSTNVGLAAIRTARVNRLISRGALDLATQHLIFSVRSGYANIIREIQQRAVNVEAIRTARYFLNFTLARFKAGQVIQLDVLNAEVQLHSRELDLVATERLLESAYDTLKQLLDLPLEEVIRVDAPEVHFGEKAEPDLKKTLESDDPSGTVSLVIRKGEAPNQKVVETKLLFQATHFDENTVMGQALEHRIDLLNARRAVAVQKINTLLAHDGLGYQVDLNGAFARTDSGRAFFERDNGSEINSWRYGISMTIPWGKIADRATYELALLAQEKSEIALKQSWTQVQVDVRNILRVLRVAEKSTLIGGRQVEQAKRAADAARMMFERGLQDSFAVITDENAYLVAKTNFISVKLDYVIDLAQLELVVGKPTGRINLAGESVGGLIDATLPAALVERGVPQVASEPESRPEEDPYNTTHEYRKDYTSSKSNPIFIESDK